MKRPYDLRTLEMVARHNRREAAYWFERARRSRKPLNKERMQAYADAHDGAADHALNARAALKRHAAKARKR